jgi:RNA polymerase sigma-70 factor (ECF subfamily)
VAVRLHRGRLALHRVLTTDLRQQTADYGLAEPASDGWQETRIWCPICGQHRLNGRLVPATGEFALRCPTCTPASDMYIGCAQLPTLQGIKSYRPALTRLLSWSDEYYRRRRTGRTVHCLFCGQLAQLREGSPICAPEMLPQINPLYVKCDHCGETTSTAHAAVALCLPEGRRFWKEHPRIRLQSAAQIEAAGSDAIVSSFASLTDAARFEVVTTRDTVEVIGIHVFP